MRSMIISSLHHRFGDEVPVYHTEVHEFEHKFETSQFPGPLRVPMTEIPVATHSVPPEHEGHELSGSSGTRRKAQTPSTSFSYSVSIDLMSLTRTTHRQKDVVVV